MYMCMLGERGGYTYSHLISKRVSVFEAAGNLNEVSVLEYVVFQVIIDMNDGSSIAAMPATKRIHSRIFLD
jgi:hypothetical protein